MAETFLGCTSRANQSGLTALDNAVYVEIERDRLFDLSKEEQEVFMPVSRFARRQGLSIECVERFEERRRATPALSCG